MALSNLFVRIDNNQIITREKGGKGRNPESFYQSWRAFDRITGPGGKVEHEPVAAALDVKRTARALKGYGCPIGFEVVKHDKGGGQRRVPAEVAFHRRGKPADGVGAPCANDKGGLR